jgi:N-acetylglucosaminyldiphosphoundecaprenol N-acetyl-beta-D-mannosaminyltransferase
LDRFDDVTNRRVVDRSVRHREPDSIGGFRSAQLGHMSGDDILDTQNSNSPDLTVAGVTVNVHSLPEGVSSIVAAAEHGDNFSVCTLNLDHVDKLRTQPKFLAAYRRARFVTADGFPIVMLSRMLGTVITRTTGADLVEPVCREAGLKHLPVFLLGSNEETLASASQQLRDHHAGLEVVGCLSPGPNFETYSGEADVAIDAIRRSGAKICFVALGAPRQEVFAARCLDELIGTGVLCIGAALDFIAGTQVRAPSFSQKHGLEWAWRMLKSPRRLGPRYARCISTVPQLLARSAPQIFNARMRRVA